MLAVATEGSHILSLPSHLPAALQPERTRNLRSHWVMDSSRMHEIQVPHFSVTINVIVDLHTERVEAPDLVLPLLVELLTGLTSMRWCFRNTCVFVSLARYVQTLTE